MAKVLDWIFVAANARIGVVKIPSSETVSGLEYVIPTTGAWIREDDKDVVLNRQIPICCEGKFMRAVFPCTYSGIIKPEPIIIEEESKPENIEMLETIIENNSKQKETKSRNSYVKEE